MYKYNKYNLQEIFFTIQKISLIASKIFHSNRNSNKNKKPQTEQFWKRELVVILSKHRVNIISNDPFMMFNALFKRDAHAIQSY